jgi:hypothetical protein
MQRPLTLDPDHGQEVKMRTGLRRAGAAVVALSMTMLLTACPGGDGGGTGGQGGYLVDLR